MANKLEQELQSLEKSIATLQKLIPKKEGLTKKLYGKKYRIASEKFIKTNYTDKWISGSRPQEGYTDSRQGLGIGGGPNVKVVTQRGLGETLNELTKKREQIKKLLGSEKVTKKSVIPNEVRYLFGAGRATLLGDYTNPYWSESHDEETFLIARNEAKKNFYDQYGKGWGGGKARRMSSKEKLAIMSKDFHPNDPLYTGEKSVRGHLGIRTSKTYLKEEDKDSIAVKTTQQNKYNTNSTQRPNRSELMSLKGADWEAATANSPAAKSGVWEPGERWKIQEAHRDWLKANNRL